MTTPGRAGPLQHTATELRDGPRSVMLRHVMPSTLAGEIIDIGRSTERMVDRMIVIALARRDAASGESTSPIPRTQMSTHLLARAIPIDGEHRAGNRIGHHTIPPRSSAGQNARRLGIDRADALEMRRWRGVR